jgi:hypothetical protein
MNASDEAGQGAPLEVHAGLLMRTIEALEPMTEHKDLVLELQRIAGGAPEAWALDWLDGDGPRRKTFIRREQALAWLEDRRGFNTELATAALRPLFAM